MGVIIREDSRYLWRERRKLAHASCHFLERLEIWLADRVYPYLDREERCEIESIIAVGYKLRMADGPEFKLLWKAQSTMVERGQQRITTALVHGHDVPKVWLVMGNLFQRYDQLENMLTDEGYEDMDFVGPLAEIERY